MAQTKRNSQPTDGAARVDADLVARAYRKTFERQELTAQERAALKRHERDKEEQLRWKFYGSIPQKHYRQMSGRQTKVLNEQAKRYGIPCGGPEVDLSKVLRSFHDFLADNAHRLGPDDDPLMQGGGSPALERYREERAAMARLDRLEREQKLLPRDEVRESMARTAAILRAAGDTLQRQFGPAAVEILYEALDDAQREIDRSFGEAGNAPGSEPASDET
ncbi:MAG: hypothetical protein AB7L90_26760 [Hyphomicrobiaceae bacterium]